MNLRTFRNYSLISLFLAHCLSAVSLPAWAASPKKENRIAIAGMARENKDNYIDAQNFVEEMYKSADSYEDYLFEYQMIAFKRGRVVEEGKFYFKKPQQIRLEETGSFRKGSIAVRGKEGKIKAKAGGGLGFIVVELSPDSGLLRSANGHPMVESDLTSLAQALRTYVRQGKSLRVTAEPVDYGEDELTEKVHILEVYHDKDQSDIFKRVTVHPRTKLPLEWWDFEKGKLVSHSRWKSFKGNVGLSDQVFTIKGEKVQ
jgi:outer membrane lipoprotein-sorting protein